MAYNVCPINVRWSSDILVLPSNQADRNGNHQYFHWCIGLKSMKIIQVLPDGSIQDLPRGQLLMRDAVPAKVLLDTGCSLSYVPSELITHLKTVVFRCPENSAVDAQAHLTEPRTAFVIPENQLQNRNLWIELQFVGRDASTVTVHCPIDPFFCTRNPTKPSATCREGLLWHNDRLVGMKGEILFGINFFQAMYVALHWPPEPMRPYVRFAHQPIDLQNADAHKLPRLYEE
ncbi:hypothetical protein FKP32DRAFT_925731 [Trametes sanguinea]|nr:hypothetical protein FKP32DRAFT_925731 [Trametes sanguinea]